VVTRARHLAALSRAPRDHVARHKRELHQKARELRATSKRRIDGRHDRQSRFALVIGRKLAAAVTATQRSGLALLAEAGALDRATDRLTERRTETLARLTAALNTHDPQRTLERGYALALGPDGEPLADTAAVRAAGDFDLRMADGTLPARVPDVPAQPTLLPDSDLDG
jgi:exodeoxyribonuclease VII large subunit